MELILKYRRPIVVGFHIALIVLANYLAFLLRFEGSIPHEYRFLLLQMLPWLITVRGLTFIPFRLYEGLWRYTSIYDLKNIIVGVSLSSVLFYSVVHAGLGLTEYPRSVFIIDSILLIFFLGGIRLTRRIYREIAPSSQEKKILIYGAGDAGEMIVRDMKNNSFYGYTPLGFIDDDPQKVGQRIHGVKVLGSRAILGQIIAEEEADAVLVAMPRADAATIRMILKALQPYKIPIKTLPNLRHFLDGKVTVNEIRNLSIEDLLERAPVGLAADPLRRLVESKRVLVTGAGGSIGSELCRQIAAMGPSELVLYERYENGLFAIVNELASNNSNCSTQAIIGDITDARRMEEVVAQYRPELLFHAAAHKHVPLMELNPCEAVKNNIIGTRIVADAAERYEVERFILISTDKAVNPSSVMGASKRAAEFVVQSMHRDGRTVFSVVRFGNVLGSNGSVVPRFQEQIKAGGPVTVTHPDMRRYFMLVPEAVQLVMHAAAVATGGEIFVLEMGEQIKVLDMARNLIRLSGFVPDEDIPIVFVGLRPGEKLSEELVGNDESVEPSAVEKISLVRAACLPKPEFLQEKLHALEQLAMRGEIKAVTKVLTEVVPTYRPQHLEPQGE